MLDLSAKLKQKARGLGADEKQTISLGRGLVRDDVSRSEEHTSELQSHHDLVCRLLLEKKKKNKKKKGGGRRRKKKKKNKE